MIKQDCTHIMTHCEKNNFACPSDIAFGPNGEVIMVYSDKNCVLVLDNKLHLLNVIGQGSGESSLIDPDGVAVMDDIIAVSDWSSDQVKKYSLQGELLSVIGCHGKTNGLFDQPRGLAFNSNKSLYVVDSNNCRVQVFHQDNTFEFSFGSKGSNPGEFQFPVRIAIDAKSNDHVLVTDRVANCIQIFTQYGHYIQAVEINGPWAITISPADNLITDYDGDDSTIKIWDDSYHLIKKFKLRGSTDSSATIHYVTEWLLVV